MTNNRDNYLFHMEHIAKTYNKGKPNELCVLEELDLTVNRGEFISIVGRSGSGKSTLMNIIGMIDIPSSGEYNFDGISVYDASVRQLTEIRRNKIGFVFQHFELIPDLNILKNVELPMLYAGIGRNERNKRAHALLEMVYLDDHADYMPNELSGGQKQRAAIARALSNDPPLLLADEPTGALDYENGKNIIELFHSLHNNGKTIMLITHDREIAEEAERIITITDGKLTTVRGGI